MSQTWNTTNTLGEVIHDHLGTYQTISSGEISESEINQFILKDTAVGENDDKNFIVDMGLTNGCKYIWMNECSKQSVSKVAMGRSHAVYQKCTLETLLEPKKMLYHSFADQEESQSYLRNPKAFQNRMREKKKLQEDQTDEKSLEAKKLLYNIVCYSIKQKSTGFRNFLYILVPDAVEDYQRYCKNIISQFLEVIPAGLRKQFRFATNAAVDKENLYHILFSRESNLQDTEKRKKSVSMQTDEIPEFLQNHGLDVKLSGLLQRCVDSFFDSSKENTIRNCFKNMEQNMGDISKIKEKDYRDYYEILTLGEQEVTLSVLKSYSEKLGETLAEKQKQMLHAQINLAITEYKTLEMILKKDLEIENADTMNLFFEAIKPYKTLIQYLKIQGIELSKEFYEWKLEQISKVFWETRCQGKKQKETEVLLLYTEEWKNAFCETNSVWTEYFTQAYVEETSNKVSEAYAKLCLQYQNEKIAEWKADVKKDFSVSKMKENCQKVQEAYPDQMKDFCQFVYDMLVAGMQKANLKDCFIKKSVNVLQEYDKQAQVPDKLYEAYVRETMTQLLEDPKKSFIETEVQKIGEIYGIENKQAFAASLLLNLAEKLTNVEKETIFQKTTEEEMSEWSDFLKELVSADKYYREFNTFENAVEMWKKKKRQEAFKKARKQHLQENVRTFEAYFYSWKNENALMEDLDVDKIRKAIYDKNNKSYTLGNFLAAVSYIEGYPLKMLLYDEELSEEKESVLKFYKNEFEKFMQKRKLPILIKKQDSLLQVYEQVETFAKLCEDRVKDIKFICMEGKKKTYEIEVGYQAAERVLDMFIQIRSGIWTAEDFKEEDSEKEHKNLSGTEKEVWKFLNQCELFSEGDCKKIIYFAEKTGTKDLEKLCRKFQEQKKKRKRIAKILRGVKSILIIAAVAAVFLAGRVSAEFFSDTPLKTEGAEVSGHVQGLKMPKKDIWINHETSKRVPEQKVKKETIEEGVSNGGEELYSEAMD